MYSVNLDEFLPRGDMKMDRLNMRGYSTSIYATTTIEFLENEEHPWTTAKGECGEMNSNGRAKRKARHEHTSRRAGDEDSTNSTGYPISVPPAGDVRRVLLHAHSTPAG